MFTKNNYTISKVFRQRNTKRNIALKCIDIFVKYDNLTNQDLNYSHAFIFHLFYFPSTKKSSGA